MFALNKIDHIHEHCVHYVHCSLKVRKTNIDRKWHFAVIMKLGKKVMRMNSLKHLEE